MPLRTSAAYPSLNSGTSTPTVYVRCERRERATKLARSLKDLAAAKMRFLVSCGMEAAPGESFNASERVVGDSFRCFASSLRLIARPAESSFRPVPGLLWSGTVGVSHKSARDARKNDLVRDFTEKLLDKRPACRLFCQSGKTIYQVSWPADTFCRRERELCP